MIPSERSEGHMKDTFELRYTGGHVEVYNSQGEFCFSADTRSEAEEELREMAQAA